MDVKKRKKLDNRIRTLIENGVHASHRSLFLLVGDKGRDQVPILYKMLCKSQIKARPSILWCYKKELGFSTHRKKRMRMLERRRKEGMYNRDSAGAADEEANLFDEMIGSANIRWTYYHETHRILGNTFGMLVLQDFEAITPNLLARTIETVEGGGVIVFLLSTLNSLAKLRTMVMDVHARYRTEAHHDVQARFNERFILSLTSLPSCLVMDDKLQVIPISSLTASIEPIVRSEEGLSSENKELTELVDQLRDTQPVGHLVQLCKTLDQAHAFLKFVDSMSDSKTAMRSMISLTAGRGRGKSACLGLAIAAAVGFNFSNIFVTSPSPENLKTLFEFVLKGFDALGMQEHLDYDVIQSNDEELGKCIIRINIHREHRQTIAYIHPADVSTGKILGQSAEIVVIDEAAAIPLPLVKTMLGPYLVFMSSTINGYEGTGRSLSLKLLKQLRQQSKTMAPDQSGGSSLAITGRTLHEVQLEESIRYKSGDQVEKWLHDLLCLDATVIDRPLSAGCPPPEQCQLFYINRDTLFSYHRAAERFLQRVMSLYVASHYKNSPNDLQMMSDAPAHHLFCLLAPRASSSDLPEVLTFIQVCLEGKISRQSIQSNLARGKRASGDLIPWTVSQQFNAHDFASLSGARIVRIASNPNYQGMGYGSRALQLLADYYSGHFDATLDENEQAEEEDEDSSEESSEFEANLNVKGQLVPRSRLKPLLASLSERRAEQLDWLGVSFGLSQELFKFWKANGFVPVYLRQTAQDLTGEHSIILLKDLHKSHTDDAMMTKESWLNYFSEKFSARFMSLLSFNFSKLTATLAMSILDCVTNYQNTKPAKQSTLSKAELELLMDSLDILLLDNYSKSLCDYHQILDLLPTVTQLYFKAKIDRNNYSLSPAQTVLMLGIALQRKSLDSMSSELKLPANQLLALLQRSVAKLTKFLKTIEEKAVEEQLFGSNQGQDNGVQVTRQDRTALDSELVEAGRAVEVEHRRQELARLVQADKALAQYAIKGSDDDWKKATLKSGSTLVSIKTLDAKKRPADGDNSQSLQQSDKAFKKKKNKLSGNQRHANHKQRS